MKTSVGILILLALWALASCTAGNALAPAPWTVARALADILPDADNLWHIARTAARGLSGLVLAASAAVLLGVPCGRSDWLMQSMRPLIAALQACPAVVWIALLMVWAGSGSGVPVTAVALAVFPVLFLNIAQGVHALPHTLFELARLYRAPPGRRFRQLIWPGIRPHWMAGLSYALAVCWKVTATAEFIGSSDGIGSRIYWSYRLLDMPSMFAWSLILIVFGVALEQGLVRPLRRAAATRKEADT